MKRKSVSALSDLNALLESATKATVTEAEGEAGGDEDPAPSGWSDSTFEGVVLLTAIDAVMQGHVGSVDEMDADDIANMVVELAKTLVKKRGTIKNLARTFLRNPSAAQRATISNIKELPTK